MNNSAVRTLYSDSGETLYQLKQKMTSNKNIFDIKKYKDNNILEIILNHNSGVEISPAHFVRLFGISIREARKIMKRMVAEGLMKVQWNGNLQRSFISTMNPLELDKIKIPNLSQSKIENIEVKDADVLKLAITKEGKLTPTMLCI